MLKSSGKLNVKVLTGRSDISASTLSKASKFDHSLVFELTASREYGMGDQTPRYRLEIQHALHKTPLTYAVIRETIGDGIIVSSKIVERAVFRLKWNEFSADHQAQLEAKASAALKPIFKASAHFFEAQTDTQFNEHVDIEYDAPPRIAAVIAKWFSTYSPKSTKLRLSQFKQLLNAVEYALRAIDLNDGRVESVVLQNFAIVGKSDRSAPNDQLPEIDANSLIAVRRVVARYETIAAEVEKLKNLSDTLGRVYGVTLGEVKTADGTTGEAFDVQPAVDALKKAEDVLNAPDGPLLGQLRGDWLALDTALSKVEEAIGQLKGKSVEVAIAGRCSEVRQGPKFPTNTPFLAVKASAKRAALATTSPVIFPQIGGAVSIDVDAVYWPSGTAPHSVPLQSLTLSFDMSDAFPRHLGLRVAHLRFADDNVPMAWAFASAKMPQQQFAMPRELPISNGGPDLAIKFMRFKPAYRAEAQLEVGLIGTAKIGDLCDFANPDV